MSNRGSSIVGEITSASASAWSLRRLASIFDDVNPIRTGAYDVSATCTMNAMNAPANPISISNNAEIARVRGVHRQQYTPRTNKFEHPMFHVCESARGVGAHHRRQYHPCQYYAPIPSHLDSALLTCAPEQLIYTLHAMQQHRITRKKRKKRNGLEAACVLVFKHP